MINLKSKSIKCYNYSYRHSSNEAIDDIPYSRGYGIKHLLSNVSEECIDLISNMIKYNPDERYSASQALRHPYFRDLYQQDSRLSLDNNQLKIISTNDSTFINKLY